MLKLITNIKGPKGDKGLTGDPTTWIKTGTGFPEGVVTAPVGTTYIDTVATSGAQQWIKKTGTGNTGWVVSVGDTGRRVLMSWDTSGTVTDGPLPTGWSLRPGYAGYVIIQRKNDRVTLSFNEVTLVKGSTLRAPFGFRPSSSINALLVATANIFQVSVTYGGVFYPASTTVYGAPDATVEYVCEQGWPSTLPGVPE